jgi:hypothetical protein
MTSAAPVADRADGVHLVGPVHVSLWAHRYFHDASDEIPAR